MIEEIASSSALWHLQGRAAPWATHHVHFFKGKNAVFFRNSESDPGSVLAFYNGAGGCFAHVYLIFAIRAIEDHGANTPLRIFYFDLERAKTNAKAARGLGAPTIFFNMNFFAAPACLS